MKLLGKDGGQTRVPALLLLAASPVVRIILSDRLPSSHSLVVTFQGVTEDTLKVFGDIISTGIAAGIMEKNLSKVEDVFNMLGVVGALVSSLSEEIDVSNVFDSNEKVFTNNIKMEALINEDSFDDKDEDRTESNKSVEHITIDPNPSQKKRAKLDYSPGIIKAGRSLRGDFPPVRINKKELTTARRPVWKAPRKSNKEESTNVKLCLTSKQHKSIRQLRSAFSRATTLVIESPQARAAPDMAAQMGSWSSEERTFLRILVRDPLCS